MADSPLLRADLQKLAKMRLWEARTLLTRKKWAGAFYLAGYAVECGLKACIAKQTARYEFPDRRRAERAYTHDLVALVGLAGIGDLIASEPDAFKVRWARVVEGGSRWSETSRYDPNVSEARARELYQAVADPDHGVLAWIRKHW